MKGRTIAVLAVFALLDLFLLLVLLHREQVGWMALREVLAFWCAVLAWPRGREVLRSSRQTLCAAVLLLLPGIGGACAFYWSLRNSFAQGAWQDLPAAPIISRSAFDYSRLIDVVPLIDVLESDDAERKKRTLLQAQQRAGTVQTAVVRIGLEDPDPEVRYYAASLLARVEEAHSRRIRELELLLAAHPDDPELWNRMAAAYQAIALQQAVEAELRTFYQEKRLAALQQSLALDPEQPLTGVYLADAWLALGQLQAAEQEAKRWVQREPHRALAVLLRVAFLQNDQARLDTYLAQVQEGNALPADLRGLFQLWQRQEVER